MSHNPTNLAQAVASLRAELELIRSSVARLEQLAFRTASAMSDDALASLPPCNAPILEHRRQHRSGRVPIIETNPALQAFILARLDRLTFKEIADEIAKHFAAMFHVHQSTIHRWAQRRAK